MSHNNYNNDNFISTCRDKIITKNTPLRHILRPLPARGQTDIYLAGTILNDFIVIADKPSGSIPGQLMFARDKRYYHALWQTLGTIVFNHATQQSTDSLQKLFFNYKEKLLFEKPNAFVLSDEIYLSQQLASAKVMLEKFKTKYHKIDTKKTILSKDAYRLLTQLELSFTENAALFVLMGNHIQNTFQDIPVWHIKFDFKDPLDYIREDIVLTPAMQRSIKLNDNKTQSNKVSKNTTTPSKTLTDTHQLTQRIAAFLNETGRGLQGDFKRLSLEPLCEYLASKHAQSTGIKTLSPQIIKGHWIQSPGFMKILTVNIRSQSLNTLEQLTKQPQHTLGKFAFKGGINKDNTPSDTQYFCEYKNGQWHSASDKIHGLGQHLCLALRQGNKNFIGKLGENMGIDIKKNKPLTLSGKHFYSDFSDDTADYLATLQDDFTFQQKATSNKHHFVNLGLLYDTPYTEKMIGVHILAKQNHIQIAEEAKKSFASVWENKQITQGTHLKCFDDEINYFLERKRELLAMKTACENVLRAEKRQ